MMFPSEYQGYYLNLDRSVDRSTSMRRHLADIGVGDRYDRFSAVDGTKLRRRKSPLSPGEIGAFASHIAVIELAAQQSKIVHVIEDDARLSTAFPRAIEVLERRGAFKAFDIVLTEMLIAPNLEAIKKLKARFDAASARAGALPQTIDLIDLAAVNFAGATSYLLSPDGARRTLQLLRREWDGGPSVPVDILLRRDTHQRKLKMACAFPFLTSFDLESTAKSTISGRARDVDSAHILALLRYGFFVGGDLSGDARAILSNIVARAACDGPDPRGEFLTALLGLIISKRFQLH